MSAPDTSQTDKPNRQRRKGMSTIVEQAVPAGTWQADPVHSSVGFAVKHA